MSEEISRKELEAQVAELLPDREEMRRGVIVIRDWATVTATGGAGGSGGQIGNNAITSNG